MLESVSTRETGTFWRTDEKLRAIKDLKMPMARFMHGMLIDQAMPFVPSTTATKTEMSLSALGRKLYLSHYCAVGGQRQAQKKFPGFLIIATLQGVSRNPA